MKVLPHVSKDERALLVVVNFSTGGEPRFQWLYEWMDANAVVVAELMMKPHYRHIDTLTGAGLWPFSQHHYMEFDLQEYHNIWYLSSTKELRKES